MEHTFIIGAIIFTAFFCESIFGFGGGLISIPLVSLLMPVRTSVTLILLFQLLTGVLVIKTAKHTAWTTVGILMVGLLLGTLVGTYSLVIFSESLLRKILSVSILLFLVKMVFFRKLTLSSKSKFSGLLAGFFGGYFQGVIGAGGPVLMMYMLTAVPNKTQLRATLIFLFFITSIVRFLFIAGTNFITQDILRIVVPLSPVFLGVVFLGQRLHWKVSDTYYRWGVYVILLCSSILLLMK